MNALRWLLAFLLAFGSSALLPSTADASSSAVCAKKKKKKKKTSKSRKKRRRSKKVAKGKKRKRVVSPVQSKTIRAWQKAGLTNDEIVERAYAGGYIHTPATARGLKKRKVRRSLQRALKAGPPAAPAVAKGPQPIDIDTEIDPNDIDFDSVAPPPGMPAELAQQHQAAHERRVHGRPPTKSRSKSRRRVVSAK